MCVIAYYCEKLKYLFYQSIKKYRHELANINVSIDRQAAGQTGRQNRHEHHSLPLPASSSSGQKIEYY